MQNVYFIKGINTAFQKQQEVNPRTKKIPYTSYQNNRSYNQPQQMRKREFNSFSDNLKLPISQSFVKYPSMQLNPNIRNNTFYHQTSPKQQNEGANMLFAILNKVKKDLSFNFLKQLDLYIKAIAEKDQLNYLKNFDRGYQRFMSSCNLYQTNMQKLFFIKLCGQKSLSNYLLKTCRDQNLSIAIPSNFNRDHIQQQTVSKQLFSAFREWKLNAISFKFQQYEKQRWIQQQALKSLKIKSIISLLKIKKRTIFVKLKNLLINTKSQKNQTTNLFNKLQNVVMRTSFIPKIQESNQITKHLSVQTWQDCNKQQSCIQFVFTISISFLQRLECLMINKYQHLFLFFRQKQTNKNQKKLFVLLHNLIITKKASVFDTISLKPQQIKFHQILLKLYIKQIRNAFFNVILTKQRKGPNQFDTKCIVPIINMIETKILQNQQLFFRNLSISLQIQPSLIDLMKNINIVNHELSNKIKKKNLQITSSERNLRMFQLMQRKQQRNLQEKKIYFQQWTSNATFSPNQYYEFVNLIKISQNEKEVILNEIDQLEMSNNEMIFNQEQVKNQTLSEESSHRYKLTIQQDALSNQEESKANQEENMKMGFEYILFLQELTVDLKHQYDGNEQLILNEQQFYQNDIQKLEKQIAMLMKS